MVRVQHVTMYLTAHTMPAKTATIYMTTADRTTTTHTFIKSLIAMRPSSLWSSPKRSSLKEAKRSSNSVCPTLGVTVDMVDCA